MSWIGPNVDCNCLCSCRDEIGSESAKQVLLDFTGLTTLSMSGGPSRPAYADISTYSCTGRTIPNGGGVGTPAFNFTGGSVALSVPAPSVLNSAPCVTDPFDMGVIEFYCTPNVAVGLRGLSVDLPNTSAPCPWLPPERLPWFAFMTAGITFSCTNGVPSWRLGVGVTIHVFSYESDTATFSVPAATSTEWTRTGLWPDPIGTYTKNGSTAAQGAQVTIANANGRLTVNRYVHHLITGSAWVSYPNTTVSLWNPASVIDWTGITTVGTATLS